MLPGIKLHPLPHLTTFDNGQDVCYTGKGVVALLHKKCFFLKYLFCSIQKVFEKYNILEFLSYTRSKSSMYAYF